MKEKIKGKLLTIGKIIGAFMLLLLILNLIFPLKVDVEFTPIIFSSNKTPLHTWITKDEQWRMKCNLNEINPELKKAIIYKEDKRFYFHPGIDILSLSRAAIANTLKLKRTSGASTITMQVARMLQHQPRTYWQKLVEMFRALQLEWYYSKDEILQLYFNLVPYGSNIQGVKAASILYFEKSPNQLSLAEITALSIIPNRPNSLVIGKDNDKIVLERNKWLKRFEKDQLFDKVIINDALNEPMTAYRHEAPKFAPQLAWRLRKMYPSSNEIIATIDEHIQKKAENLTENYSRILQLQGIYNASVIIINNKSHEVVCYIGSSNFYDLKHQGQVDGVKASRSPGSTLKPILYGLGIAKGYLTPKTIIADVPININGYCPENYDLDFRGNVSIEDALRQSLNIPAVKTLDKIGVSTMINYMQNAGFTTFKKKKYALGLSMILGGCEVRLDELSNYYSSLSNGGVYKDLCWVKDSSSINNQKNNKGKRVLDEASAYLISNILSDLARPDLPNMASNAIGVPKIAWKTGTSYARKDAWSIGYDANYTIGVWIGNFNGDGAQGLSGATTATPLLFQLFNSIKKNSSLQYLNKPNTIASRIVCSESGKIPAPLCTNLTNDDYLPGISNNEICEHLKTFYLSADEQFSYCTSCLPVNGFKTKVFENISPELASFYDSKHIKTTRVPEHNPDCTRMFEGVKPKITSLQNEMSYIIVDQNQELQLACEANIDVTKLYWYLNDQFYASVKKGEKINFKPRDSRIKISCTDDQGRTSSIHINVQY